jgi:hypothetical protein
VAISLRAQRLHREPRTRSVPLRAVSPIPRVRARAAPRMAPPPARVLAMHDNGEDVWFARRPAARCRGARGARERCGGGPARCRGRGPRGDSGAQGVGSAREEGTLI